MTARKPKLLYALVVLLFLFVITLVGWLAYSLFALQVAPPKAPPKAPASVSHRQAGAGPFSETVIDIEALPEPAIQQEVPADAVDGEATMPDDTGHIPCLCEGYGPAITSREAHANPLTHQTAFSATRAVVTLTFPSDPPRDEP